MMKVLDIATIGAKVLNDRSDEIINIHDRSLQDLIDRLIITAEASNGVGIAAPQVSKGIRLFIVASRPNLRYPNAPKMEPTAMINPRIINHSEEIVIDWEGCLSVPKKRGKVPRYQWIEVEYFNREGLLIQQILTDFVARIFQHEYDHLDGILFIDRVVNPTDIITEEEYQKLHLMPTNNQPENPPEKILCPHCQRTATNGIKCKGICVADNDY